MGVVEIFTIVMGFFKFFSELAPLVKMLIDTPAENRQQAIAAAHNAYQKALETKGDTSAIEDGWK